MDPKNLANVIGQLNGKTWYKVQVSVQTGVRVRELSVGGAGVIPECIFGAFSDSHNGVTIWTPEPDWFADLDRAVLQPHRR